MHNRDKMLKFTGQAPMCANAMLAVVSFTLHRGKDMDVEPAEVGL